jgi:4-hydroxy-tetrahydrodipicolinate reductase
MLRISVLGAGRMGREIIGEIASADDLQLAGVWMRADRELPPGMLPSGSAAIVSGDLDEVVAAADVAVDFSLAEATRQVLAAVTKASVPLVCGVTGLDVEEMRQLARAARSIPLLYDRNMSLGIAVLKDLVERAAPRLSGSFVAEVDETHHVHKKDAPSGTAIALGETLARSLGRNFDEVYRYQPGGDARRTREDIVFSVTRRGEVAGEHTVRFRSEAECLELTHRVSDRRVFAQGALQAARWLEGREPGLYQMSHLLRSVAFISA